MRVKVLFTFVALLFSSQTFVFGMGGDFSSPMCARFISGRMILDSAYRHKDPRFEGLDALETSELSQRLGRLDWFKVLLMTDENAVKVLSQKMDDLFWVIPVALSEVELQEIMYSPIREVKERYIRELKAHKSSELNERWIRRDLGNWRRDSLYTYRLLKLTLMGGTLKTILSYFRQAFFTMLTDEVPLNRTFRDFSNEFPDKVENTMRDAIDYTLNLPTVKRKLQRIGLYKAIQKNSKVITFKNGDSEPLSLHQANNLLKSGHLSDLLRDGLTENLLLIHDFKIVPEALFHQYVTLVSQAQREWMKTNLNR